MQNNIIAAKSFQRGMQRNRRQHFYCYTSEWKHAVVAHGPVKRSRLFLHLHIFKSRLWTLIHNETSLTLTPTVSLSQEKTSRSSARPTLSAPTLSLASSKSTGKEHNTHYLCTGLNALHGQKYRIQVLYGFHLACTWGFRVLYVPGYEGSFCAHDQLHICIHRQ